MAKRLYLVDGTSQLFRAYFAIRGLSNPEGLPTNAVYGFTTMLRRLIREREPHHLAVAFDVAGKTFRHDRYADYKANRPSPPEDLSVQIPYAKRVCRALRIAVLELEGYEADDLIATYARLAREAGFEVTVVASDKDLLQLVDDGVDVLDPVKNAVLDASGVEEEFGVRPERVRDVLGLMGDSVDNIPGVPGVGEKTALSLIREHGGLEQVLDHARRFTEVFDARDAVIELLDAAQREHPLSEASRRRIAATCRDLAPAIARLGDRAADAAFRGRLEEAAETVAACAEDLDGGGSAGARKRLKGCLKGLEKGSRRRIWYAVRDHAEQASLSRELATVDRHVPVAFDTASLRMGSPDEPSTRALFTELGFKSLMPEVGLSDGAEERERAPEVKAEYACVLGAADLERIAARCREAGLLALDTATDGGDPMRARLVGISLAWSAGRAAYVPVGHDYLGAPDQLPLDAVRDVVGPLLADPSVEKVAHDLKFDLHVLRRHGLPVDGWATDTMVAAFLLNPGRAGFKLDSLSDEYLGHRTLRFADLAGEGSRQVPLDQLEVDRVTDYAAEEADMALRLAGVLGERLEVEGLARLYREVDGPLLPILARMEARGIRVRTDVLATMSGEMERALAKTRSETHALAGCEFNVDSPKQLREVLFDRLGLKSRRKTAKGGLRSTDARTLEELAGEHEIARKILEYRELAKLKGTYVDSLPKLVNPDTGRVHTCFHPTGAATGRLSSSDPNLQNIPARTAAGLRIRSAFVPEDGCVFLASDYSQVELRVLAHLSGDGELLAAFRRGDDIHRHTASRVFGVEPERVTDVMRRRAKAVNFGVLYGMSGSRLAVEQGITRSEARRFIEAYFDRFERVRAYIDRVRTGAERDAAVRTLFGRVRHFPQLRQSTGRAVREQAMRAAVNTTVQGTAADLMKMAMLGVERALARAELRTRMVLQVHDELLFEVPEDELETAQSLVREVMEGVHSLDVPLVVDQKVGRSWMEVT